MIRHCLPLLLALCCLLPAGARADEETLPPPAVVPTPKKLSPDRWNFAFDDLVVVMVSERATLGTRRAARIVQLGLRERLGIDAPIALIARRTRLAPGSKPIWVVEPRLDRAPARTIGVPKLRFTDPMLDGGYFIRVDAVEAVLHGATDAGSCNAAQTLLQMIHPARPGSFFRKAKPPAIPCLWIADWPSRPLRALPRDFPLPNDAPAAAAFTRLLGRYRLNAVSKDSLPTDAQALAAFRDDATRYSIGVLLKGMPEAPQGELAAIAGRWMARGPCVEYAIAALAEAWWTDKAPTAEAFRRQFARSAFHNADAAEAIALTEQCLATPAPRQATALLDQAKAIASGDDAARHADARKQHRRRAERLRRLWSAVKERPELRDAFLQVAEDEIAARDTLLALADARVLAQRGRLKAAANTLLARKTALEGDATAGEARLLLESLARRLRAAASADPPPALDSIWKATPRK